MNGRTALALAREDEDPNSGTIDEAWQTLDEQSPD